MELVMLVGIPGSGKSTIAEQYAEDGYRIHSSDQLRAALYGDENVQGNASEVFSLLIQNVRKDLRRGCSCVMDATNLNRKRRRSTLAVLSGCMDQTTCALVIASPETCRDRISRRERKVSDDVLHRMLCSFETPYGYEGWDRIDVVFSGDAYVFPREKSMHFPQDSRYHTLTLGEHMEAARDYSKTHGFSETVQEAAWYHDIGKMYTKSFLNRRGEPSDTAHFYMHENYGAYLYLCEKAAAASGSVEMDPLYIANLINWHMRPMTGWQQAPHLREKDRSLLGDRMFEELNQLHEADLAAH